MVDQNFGCEQLIPFPSVCFPPIRNAHTAFSPHASLTTTSPSIPSNIYGTLSLHKNSETLYFWRLKFMPRNVVPLFNFTNAGLLRLRSLVRSFVGCHSNRWESRTWEKLLLIRDTIESPLGLFAHSPHWGVFQKLASCFLSFALFFSTIFDALIFILFP